MESSHFLLAEILPDGQSHGGEPGPGARHVAHHGPGVLPGVIALYRVVISEKRASLTRRSAMMHYLHNQS